MDFDWLDNIFTVLVLGAISLVMLGFGLLLALGGLLLIGEALVAWTLLLLSRGWRTTTGEILTAERGSDGHEPTLDISYRYVVDGRPHTSTRVAFAGVTQRSKRWRAMEAPHTYRLGRQVRVYYDPVRPDWSTLDRSLPRGQIRGFLGGLALLVAGAIFVGAGGSGLLEVVTGSVSL